MNGWPEKFLRKVRVRGPDDCWLWTGAKMRDGYGNFKWERRNYRAHRFAWLWGGGATIPPRYHVMHRCDTPLCVNPAHLALGTDADNVADKLAKGRHLSGDRSPTAKLTAAQARAIFADPRTQRAIAAEYGVHEATVWMIKHGRNWRRNIEGLVGLRKEAA